MPPATAPTPAPTAAPTGPPTTAPVTAPVVAPAAAPPCACEATGSDSAAAIVAPVSILISSNPPLLCAYARRRRTSKRDCCSRGESGEISFLQGTFFPFDHFPGIEFKTLGGFDGTGDAPRWGSKGGCNRRGCGAVDGGDF